MFSRQFTVTIIDNRTEHSSSTRNADLHDCLRFQFLPASTTSIKANLVAISVLYLLIAPFTALMNLSVLIVVRKNQRLQTLPHVLLANLSVTDMLTGFLTLPVFAVFYILASQGQIHCQLYTVLRYFSYCFATMSYISLLFIWTERYFAIFHPYFHARWVHKSLVVKLLIIQWIICFLIYVPLFLIPRGRIVKHILILTVMPLSFLWSFYVQMKTIIIVKKIQREVSTLSRSYNNRHIIHHCKNNATKVSMSILLALFICYLPFCIVSPLQYFFSNLEQLAIANITFEWSVAFVLFNSLCNVM